MLRAIFYDLETSDRNPIGQILNYSFIAVDENLSAMDELSGDVRISRLQLPAPDAILANRINVLEHQESAAKSEREAMGGIASFIGRLASKAPRKIALVGFNSNRFDLAYLRTSLIRNGINPYFGGRLAYRDLYHAAKRLSVTREDFPRHAGSREENGAEQGEPRLCLSLENLAQRLNILTGRQAHHSRDDVLLSLALARVFRERFALDVLSYDSYEIARIHQSACRHALEWQLQPNYDLGSEEIALRVPMALLDANHRYALWIDLPRYGRGEKRSSICWFGQGVSSFIHGGAVEDEPLQALAQQARSEFSGITVDNFFPVSVCDIEQDIYRLDMQRIDLLNRAIWQGAPSAAKSCRDRDVRVLLLRHELANYKWSQGGYTESQVQGFTAGDERMAQVLKRYALHRYGGGLKMQKGDVYSGAQALPAEAFHPTYREMSRRVENLLNRDESGRDKEILTALRRFYISSDLYKAAGAQLEKI